MLGLLASRRLMSTRGTLLVPLEHCVYDRRCRLHSTKPHCVEQARRAVAAAAVVEARARGVRTNSGWSARSTGRISSERVVVSVRAYRSYVGAVRQRCLDLATEATMIFGGEDEDTCGNRDTGARPSPRRGRHPSSRCCSIWRS